MSPALLLVASLLGQIGQGQGLPFRPSEDFVATKDKVFVLLPPEIVCGPFVQEAKWSSSGNWMLITRMEVAITRKFVEAMAMGAEPAPPPSKRSIMLWSGEGRRPIELLSVNEITSTIEKADWLPGQDRGLVLTHEQVMDGSNATVLERWVLYNLKPNSPLEPIYRNEAKPEEAPYIQVDISPKKPLAFFRVVKISQQPKPGEGAVRDDTLYLLNAAGQAQKVKLPGTRFAPGWTEAGDPYITHFLIAEPEYYAVNPASGELRKLAEAPKTNNDFAFVMGNAELKANPDVQTSKSGGQSVQVGSLWLSIATEGEKSAYVAGAIEGLALAPTMKELAYIQSGSLFVRGVTEIPRKAYDEAQAKAKRAELLTSVKQVGLAGIMYAADHDDNFPSSKSDISELLMPYLRSPQMFVNFVWTFPGGSATEIKDPMTTELGFIPGPGGRAVVYADGHAVWVADPPKKG